MPPIDPEGGTIDDTVATALRERNSLTKAQIEEVAKNFGITVDANGAGEPTTLTIRRPFAHQGAHLTMPLANDVRPEVSPDGAMSVRQGGSLRRVRDTGPPRTPSATAEEYSRATNPLNPGFPPDAVVEFYKPGSVGIHLETEPYRAYVVSCRVAGTGGSVPRGTPGHFAVVARRGGKYSHMIRELVPASGRVSFAIPRKKGQQTYDLALVGYWPTHYGLQPFSLSGCDIVPVD